MWQSFQRWVMQLAWPIIVLSIGITIFLSLQLSKLHWETDARVYMPKGHPAILYDEKVEHIFGSKDAVIIAITNDDGIFNAETLARIARVTEKVAALPGVVANRLIDVTSISTASVFEGTEEAIGARRIMPTLPTTPQEIEKLKADLYDNADLFVGNIVSPDGKAAMIRAKLKEGMTARYQSYWQIKGIVDAESGKGDNWQKWNKGGGDAGGDWQKWNKPAAGAQADANTKSDAAPVSSGAQGDWQKWNKGGAQPDANAKPDSATPSSNGQWPASGQANGPQNAASPATTKTDAAKDQFFLAGRPVVEVTSGMEAMKDMQVMVPLLIAVIAFSLFVIFRTWSGVLLPLTVMAMGVLWTMGTMALLDVPMYTISTMLPVILVAVGIGNGIHVISHYYDHVLQDSQRDRRVIVADVMSSLGAPLVVTSLTTAIGFLTLWFAEMPPFKVFGLFTVLGIFYCWLLSVALIPAVLSRVKPKVGGYLQKRQAMRVYSEQSRWVKQLVDLGSAMSQRGRVGVIVLIVLSALALLGGSKMFVDSSWMSDFRSDSDLSIANKLINEKFSGSIRLHVIVDGKQDGALKSLKVLQAMDDLQKHLKQQPMVGDSISIVNYLKSMNKTMHAGDKAYDTLPDSDAQVAEYLFLFSISGRPDELEEVVDFTYRQANMMIMIKTDHTKELRAVIDDVKSYAAQRFGPLNVDVNLAGSANNSYLWADMLIGSQTTSIIFSKVGIAILAALLFRSIIFGLFVIVPVTLSTLLIAAASGVFAIPLDVSTALAAGVAIGVGVDYAVHYIYSYRRARLDNSTYLAATQATLRGVGKTIVFNAVVVTAGFVVLFFSVFPPHVKLGYFVAAYMVISCVTALLVLPLILQYAPREREAAEA